jgi:hypothetical protein
MKTLLLLFTCVTSSIYADSSAEKAAKELANPVAALISLPIQVNYQPNIGPTGNGSQWLTNVQPVIPIDFNDEWNIISRTIIPLVSKDIGVSGVDRVSGVGDIVQSAWVSPKSPTKAGWIWGAGAAFLIPSGSDVSARKWGAGPTGLALKQDGPWTYGGLFNHIWSFGGNDAVTASINQTFVQPFLTYITPQAVTFALNTETIYDWENDQFTIPLNFSITKVTKIGGQMISYGAGVTYWAEAPTGGPNGWGARFILTFIFPK